MKFSGKWFPDPASYTEGRLFSLDLLRGCDMLFLVFLQPLLCTIDRLFGPFGYGLPDCVRAQLVHNWGGFTAYDIIMPMFIFMCGAAVPFALGRRLTADGRPTAAFWKHVAWRVAMLWVFGMMTQGRLLTFDAMKISPYNNTLQTIAAGYLIAALVLLVRSRAARWGVAAALVAVYSAVLVCCGDYSQTGNAAYRFDQWILTFLVPAGSKAFGEHYTWFLTTFMFGFMTLCGMFATEILTAKDRPMQAKALRLTAFGAALLAGGWLLVACGIPMIKHIFTASFTLQAMGWCVLFFALLYELTDILRWRRGLGVLLLLGQCALLLYMANGVFGGCVRTFPKRLLGDLPNLMGLPAKPLTQADRLGYAFHSLIITLGYFATLIVLLAIRYRLRQANALEKKSSSRKVPSMKYALLSLVLPLAVCASAADETFDLVIYGSSPAAISAAVQASRMGRRAVIVSPETRIGGLTTGGLGQTDIGNKSAFGGIALEFYRAVAEYYRDERNWTRQTRGEYLPDGQCAGTKGADSMWTFEPSAALKILEGWEKRDGLDIRRGEFLDRAPGGTRIEGEGARRRIVSFRTLSGNVYRGRMFIDATYEGDLMASAGVTCTVGREANSVYGETLNGCQKRQAVYHQLEKGVDPYVRKGDPSSGLLPNVEPFDPETKDGDGDRRVQAYCFRMCLTDVPENRIPFAKPANYDERDYELLFRHFEAKPASFFAGDIVRKLPWINSKMPNRKTDTNNRDGFSTDFIGRNWAWPEASYEERTKILKAHLDYQRGLMWTLANHPRIPVLVRREVSRWGTCRDEFADGLGDGWQSQLYVREARRMVGETVMTERHCRGQVTAMRPVAMAAYTMDSHNVRRHVGTDGCVHNEGDVEVGGGLPYPIDYGAIVPKRGECANLFVPVCMSASHIAFGSIRMEPVFFALGQAAATAAALTIDADCPAQDLAYGPLRRRLLADGQVLVRAGTPEPKTAVGVSK